MIRRWWDAFPHSLHAIILSATGLCYMLGSLMHADMTKGTFSLWHPRGFAVLGLLIVGVYGIAAQALRSTCYGCQRAEKELETLRAALKETR